MSDSSLGILLLYLLQALLLLRDRCASGLLPIDPDVPFDAGSRPPEAGVPTMRLVDL